MSGTAAMRMTRTRHVDTSGPDENGDYHDYYEYDVYLFVHGRTRLYARSYTDRPAEAHFLSRDAGWWRSRFLRARHFRQPLFRWAVARLREEGKTELNFLDAGRSAYAPVPDPP